MTESEYAKSTGLANMRGASHLLGCIVEAELDMSISMNLRKIRAELFQLADTLAGQVETVEDSPDSEQCIARIR